MEIYAPLAHRLGMQKLKWELEDLSCAIWTLWAIREIEDEMSARSAATRSSWPPSSCASSSGWNRRASAARCMAEVKHTYSIYRKMFAQNKTLDEIFDPVRLPGDRGTTSRSATTCWAASTICSSRCWAGSRTTSARPSPICTSPSTPRSLAGEGIPFEVQIRTGEMHQTAEYGIAAHWKYKQGMANKKLGSEVDFEWVRKLLESQQDTDAGGVCPAP